MNKEVKEIVKSINTRKEYVGAPYMTLETKKIDLLLNYINQLETNRDESIEYIKHSWWLRTDQTYDTSKDLKGWEVEELLSILERGKDESNI